MGTLRCPLLRAACKIRQGWYNGGMTYSQDLHERVVHAVEHGDRVQPAVAAGYAVSLSFVKEVRLRPTRRSWRRSPRRCALSQSRTSHTGVRRLVVVQSLRRSTNHSLLRNSPFFPT